MALPILNILTTTNYKGIKVPKEAKHKRDQVPCKVLTANILQDKQNNENIYNGKEKGRKKQ